MEAPRQKSAKGPKLTPSSSSSSSSSSPCFITNLPSPVLMEILCRLPIKTLTASKCVCKAWLNLSRDPYFPHLHQSKAPTEVCFQLWKDKDTLKLHMGNFRLLNNFDPLDVKLNTLFELPKFSVRPNGTLNFRAGVGDFKFSNSCNGLLCYYGGLRNKFVMIWNPYTSEFITLPTPPLGKKDCCCYGLGFSGNANKYKILRVVHQKSHDIENVIAEILTIEKGCSWSSLGPCPSYVREVEFHGWNNDPVFLHGTLHWVDSSFSYYMNILTFDFEGEQFGKVPLPPSVGEDRDSCLCQVGELLGCLFVTEYTGKGINIWLMKEYGVQDSWTKMYSFPCIVEGERIYERCFRPVTCMDNGEILLVHDRFQSINVFSYNPDLEGFRRIGSGRAHLRVIPYRPSLVLLKDSMLGYEVRHVSALKHRVMSKTPKWWTPSVDKGRKGHVWDTSESSASYSWSSDDSD